MTPLDVMWVGLGGGLGSLLRWLTGPVIGEHYRGGFPAGTFLINVSDHALWLPVFRALRRQKGFQKLLRMNKGCTSMKNCDVKPNSP
jgi:fluoride ion exporter CrcB/FEX